MAKGEQPPGTVREPGLLPCPSLFVSLTPTPALLEEGSSRLPSTAVPPSQHRGARPVEGNPLRCQRCLHPDSSAAREQSSALPHPRGQLRERSLPRGCSSSKASQSKLPGLKLAGHTGTACSWSHRAGHAPVSVQAPSAARSSREQLAPCPRAPKAGAGSRAQSSPLLLHQHLVRVKLLSHPLRR